MPHSASTPLANAVASLLLAACGEGGGGGDDNAPSALAPWSAAWAERWSAPSLGMAIDHPQPDCKGSRADPAVPVYDAFIGVDPAAATWATLGPVSGLSVNGRSAHISSQQQEVGWALNSYRAFDHTRSLRLSGRVDLKADRGAWLGLALIVNEANYRKIARYEQIGTPHAGAWAPCHIRPLTAVAAVAAAPHRLTLTYAATGRYLLALCHRRQAAGRRTPRRRRLALAFDQPFQGPA